MKTASQLLRYGQLVTQQKLEGDLLQRKRTKDTYLHSKIATVMQLPVVVALILMLVVYITDISTIMLRIGSWLCTAGTKSGTNYG